MCFFGMIIVARAVVELLGPPEACCVMGICLSTRKFFERTMTVFDTLTNSMKVIFVEPESVDLNNRLVAMTSVG